MNAKTQWIVMKDDKEFSRHASKRIAEAAAQWIGGYVIPYRKEG